MSCVEDLTDVKPVTVTVLSGTDVIPCLVDGTVAVVVTSLATD